MPRRRRDRSGEHVAETELARRRAALRRQHRGERHDSRLRRAGGTGGANAACGSGRERGRHASPRLLPHDRASGHLAPLGGELDDACRRRAARAGGLLRHLCVRFVRYAAQRRQAAPWRARDVGQASRDGKGGRRRGERVLEPLGRGEAASVARRERHGHRVGPSDRQAWHAHDLGHDRGRSPLDLPAEPPPIRGRPCRSRDGEAGGAARADGGARRDQAAALHADDGYQQGHNLGRGLQLHERSGKGVLRTSPPASGQTWTSDGDRGRGHGLAGR
mmetsp:Transcript_8082/g.17091  ORF Transcript_8082/g.17091 Transcript_8082/m.17091 type:complete len:276 (+) Transcript_8082:188-1015(+)